MLSIQHALYVENVINVAVFIVKTRTYTVLLNVQNLSVLQLMIEVHVFMLLCDFLAIS